jgi:nicotinamide mononucleotide (NMN) deamidase PncC
VVEAALPEEGVEPLAAEVRRTAGANVGLATGALLGPQDDPPDRPYGVLVAAVDLEGEVARRRFCYSGERARVRDLAADAALNLLRLRLLGGGAGREAPSLNNAQ